MNQRNLIAISAVVLIGGLLLAMSILRVPEDKQAIILQFGRPVATVNTYKPNQLFGETGAGLVLTLLSLLLPLLALLLVLLIGFWLLRRYRRRAPHSV